MNITVVLDKHPVYTYQHDVETNAALTTNGKFYLGKWTMRDLIAMLVKIIKIALSSGTSLIDHSGIIDHLLGILRNANPRTTKQQFVCQSCFVFCLCGQSCSLCPLYRLIFLSYLTLIPMLNQIMLSTYRVLKKNSSNLSLSQFEVNKSSRQSVEYPMDI